MAGPRKQLGHHFSVQFQNLVDHSRASCSALCASAMFPCREQVEQALRTDIVHLWPKAVRCQGQAIGITGGCFQRQAREKPGEASMHRRM